MKKPSRKTQSVYRNQNALVRAVFERAGDARKVLCVALDYAKRKHVALICDGHGDVLKSSFPVENNAAGIAHLIKEITATARSRKIPKDQIFLGGEDEAAYIANFTETLRAKGYLVVRVNATRPRKTAKISSPAPTPSTCWASPKPFSPAAPASPATPLRTPPSTTISAKSPVVVAPSSVSKPPLPTASTPSQTNSSLAS